MKIEIKVPAMGESITEATVGELLKPTGSSVRMDEEVIELETDKVNQVLYAPATGAITFTVSMDDTVKVGEVIGFVDSESVGNAAPATPSPPSEPEQEEAKPKPDVIDAPPPASQPDAVVGHASHVTKSSFIEELKSPSTSASEPLKAEPTVVSRPKGERETRERMPRIRQVIAARLLDAQHSTAMLTTFNECDMSAVMDLRAQYKEAFLEKYGVKLGFMSFFVKAVVSALQLFPKINAFIDGNEIVQRHYYDIGIAVSSTRGLVVPVVRDCDQMAFSEIEGAIGGFAKKARDGKLVLDDLTGGGFTITNGGTFGSLLSTPILNPPQSAILGMHKIQKRPMCIGDEVVARPMMYLALSYDHRIIDGSEAVQFLVHIKECIEDPSRLLLSV
jgi:2-oxoglutarate dehydrogenase E2 component (dihydrolipoamide succinyltransferase)